MPAGISFPWVLTFSPSPEPPSQANLYEAPRLAETCAMQKPDYTSVDIDLSEIVGRALTYLPNKKWADALSNMRGETVAF